MGDVIRILDVARAPRAMLARAGRSALKPGMVRVVSGGSAYLNESDWLLAYRRAARKYSGVPWC